METISQTAELRQRVAAWKGAGHRVGFVPTMGALHEGHLALVRRAVEVADRVVASIFVNPTQFGPGEDFQRYPRDLEGDAGLLACAGCDLLFLPEVTTIYPQGHSTFVEVQGVSAGLEGAVQATHQRPQFRRCVPWPGPEDARPRPVTDTLQRQFKRCPPNFSGLLLQALADSGGNRADESQRDVQVGLRHPFDPLAQQRLRGLRQRRAHRRIRPQRKEQSLAGFRLIRTHR